MYSVLLPHILLCWKGVIGELLVQMRSAQGFARVSRHLALLHGPDLTQLLGDS